MLEISIERNPKIEKLSELGVSSWPIWIKEASEFPWIYNDAETCFFLEGEVEVTPQGGDTVKLGKGDLVTFPVGMSCMWKIIKDVKKHYSFS